MRHSCRGNPTSVKVITPRHSARAADGTSKLRQLGGSKVQVTANVPVDIDVGNSGEIAMETIDSDQHG
jgi:hypothetical protein